ncbi:MAG: ABC transporter ATP-binding protein [Alphaproteobacteria bacterium]
MNSPPPALELKDIGRRFRQGEAVLHVLNGASVAVRSGEIVSLVGPSGAGKSTLLHVAGLLERPDDGEVLIAGDPCGRLSDDRRTRLRREYLGFVYQYHHLLPEFSALENVVLPQMIAGVSRRAAADRARGLLERMGLGPRAEHRPGQLSGGEQQRVAIARALANGPRVLLADEPTGNLDPGTAARVFDELLRLVREDGLAALIATHNPDLAGRMDRVIELRDGRLETSPNVPSVPIV